MTGYKLQTIQIKTRKNSVYEFTDHSTDHYFLPISSSASAELLIRKLSCCHPTPYQASVSVIKLTQWRLYSTSTDAGARHIPNTDALNEGIPQVIGFIFGIVKTRMAGLQSREDRMMINQVDWALYINVTDTQTDSHISIANTALTHCVGWQKYLHLSCQLETNNTANNKNHKSKVDAKPHMFPTLNSGIIWQMTVN